jgi:hypothetical protein
MVTRKRYVMPELDLEGAGAQVAELVAFAEELTGEANEVVETVLELKAEIARLRKARKRRLRTSK